MSPNLMAYLLLWLSQKTLGIDYEWLEMVRTNPHPEKCQASELKSKAALRYCILEQMWVDEIRTETRRHRNDQSYNFTADIHNLIPIRMKHSPTDHLDCLTIRRPLVRIVPYDCYTSEVFVEGWEERWLDFIGQIINELRFTFDYVLFDNLCNTNIEDEFWYLILYLKKFVTETPNPFTFASAINTAAEFKNRFYGKVQQMKEIIKQTEHELQVEIDVLKHAVDTLTPIIKPLMNKVVLRSHKINQEIIYEQYYKGKCISGCWKK